jgi:hypothetical protein
VVRWAAAAEPHSQLLSTILTANKTAEARSRIAAVLQAEHTAKEILVSVSETAKIDSRHFTDGGSWREIAQRLESAARDAEGLFNHAVFATVLEESPKGLFPLSKERLKNDGSLDGLAEQLEAVAVRQMEGRLCQRRLRIDEIPRQQTRPASRVAGGARPRDHQAFTKAIANQTRHVCAASPGQWDGPQVHLDGIGADR